MPAIDVIVNRRARRLASDGGLRARLVAAAQRSGARVHETRTLDELSTVARRLAEHGTDGVVLAGGDGSHMAGVSVLRRAFGDALPPLGLAPGGTVGTVARNLGQRGGAAAWTERLIAAACAGTARLRAQPTLRVADEHGIERMGFIFGAGLVARFFQIYDQARRPGLATAAGLAARVFLGALVGTPLARRVLEPAPCALTVDGVAHEHRRWSLVVASVFRDLGLHLRPTYRAGTDADRFHVVASGQAPRALGWQAPRVVAGRPLRGEPCVDALARSLHLGFDSGAGAYVLDGDLLLADRPRVEAGPSLRLLLP